MPIRHVQGKARRTAKETVRLRADRERYQRERPTPEQLLAEGGHDAFVSLGGLLTLHQIMASLRRERERQGLTLAALAGLCGMDSAMLSRLETGKQSNPTLDTLCTIAAALGKVISCTIRNVPKKSKRSVPELPG